VSIFLLLAILAAGLALGWLAKTNAALAKANRRLATITLWALLAAMGAKLALHIELFNKDLHAMFAAIGSSVALLLAFFLVFWIAGAWRRIFFKGAAAPRPAISANAPIGPAIGWMRELLSVGINGGCIIAGFIIILLLPGGLAEALPVDAAADWLLHGLLFFIGFDLGAELHRLDLRGLSPMFLLAPFFNMALSLLTGLLFGLTAGLGACDGALLASGMGWYSLSSVLIADRGMIMLSLLSFIHNVFRELLAILFAPMAARVSPMLPVYLGGATSMDVMLPFVQRYSGKEYTLISFYSGAICSIAVAPLVEIIAG
jgi:uncharacterized membrane protein YbjE (DUF340 family)